MLRVLCVMTAVAGALASTTTIPQTVAPSEFDCSGKAYDHYYPSAADCAIYYRCPASGSNALKYDCEPDTVFYEPNQGCDWDYNVPPPCGNSTSTPVYTTQTGETITPETNPFYCAGLTPGSYPDPDCCNKFYVCDSQADPSIAAIPQYCPDGLAFNPVGEYCDFPSNVPGCETLACVD